jgi:hypothetical protein
MAIFVFSGEQEVVFPTIAVTAQPGATFEAPDDFVAEGVTLAKKGKAAPITEVAEIVPATIESTPAEEGTI